MRLLHMGDLHLGKTLLEAPLLEDQAAFLQQAAAVAAERQVDALLLAGDIYDRAVPSAEAVAVFSGFLEALHDAGIPVLAIAGNHDSPERLAFGSRILSREGTHLAGVYRGDIPRVVLRDGFGEVTVWLLPFLRPATVREALGVEAATTHEAVAAALAAAPVDSTGRNVLVAHQFVCAFGAPPETCDSESVYVGGSDNVDAALFDRFDYVALGHLHRGQAVGRETIRYAGSPLKYSLSERSHRKSCPLITLGEKGDISVELLPVPPVHDLRKVRGPIDELIAAGQRETEGREDYIWAVLTGEPVLNPAEKLRRVYPRLLQVDVERPRAEQDADAEEALPSPKSEEELFAAFFQQIQNKPLSEPQSALIADMLRSLREKEGLS